MFNFLVGVVVGIVISTVGLSGVANMVDRGVGVAKTIIQNNAQ
jgi:hypothetical protein